jgi:hypothetical protein
MMIRRSGTLVALSVALFLAGCAGNTAGTGSAAGDSSPAPLPPPLTSPGVIDPSAGPGAVPVPDADISGSAKPGLAETVTGTVTAGVEPGCLMLTGAKGPYLLIVTGDMTKTVKVGTTVSVTGRPEPGLITTCQQGTPFVVTKVNPQ